MRRRAPSPVPVCPVRAYLAERTSLRHLRGVASQYARGCVTAEDILSEALERMLSKAELYTEGNVAGWCAQVTRRVALNALRDEGTRRTRFGYEAEVAPESGDLAVMRQAPQPSEEARVQDLILEREVHAVARAMRFEACFVSLMEGANMSECVREHGVKLHKVRARRAEMTEVLSELGLVPRDPQSPQTPHPQGEG